MPASRRARAMIFAPRSWPSKPGLAITTRIFPGTAAQVYERETHGRGLLPGMAEPRRRAIGLPRRRGWAPPARLRPGSARAARGAAGIARHVREGLPRLRIRGARAVRDRRVRRPPATRPPLRPARLRLPRQRRREDARLLGRQRPLR